MPHIKISCFLWIMIFLQVLPAFGGDSRKRISAMVAEADEIARIEAEIIFGREVAARILGTYRYDDDPKLNRYVTLVGRGVAMHSDRPELTYHFAVLDSDEINAFAAPGGYVFITRAALQKMRNEAQLAGVLGHEIAHIARGHMLREIQLSSRDESAVSGIANLIGGATGGAVKSLELAMDRATAILFENGYKIIDEFEADRIGMLMAAAAGYDPNALAVFLAEVKRFEKEDRNYSGDHPMHVLRISEMKIVSEASGFTQKGKATVAERFYENVAH